MLCGRRRNSTNEDGNRITSLIFSVLFSLDCMVGSELYTKNQIEHIFENAGVLFLFFLKTSALSVIIYLLFEKLILRWIIILQKRSFEKQVNVIKIRPVLRFFLIWAGVFLSWFPVFLAYYPGILSYDSHTQTKIVFGIMNNSCFHPPLHTFIWKSCIDLGSIINVPALALYSIMQMTVLSFVLAYMLCIIAMQQPFFLFSLFSFSFIALNPVMGIMSLAITKDVLFAAVLTALTILYYRMEKDSGVFFNHLRYITALIILNILACLLRNNMIYVLVLSYVMMIIIKKEFRLQLMSVLIISFFGYCFINGPVYDRMGIGPGNSREMLSVPIQQICRTVVTDDQTISEEEKTQIDDFIPYESIDSLYNPRFADPVKNKFNTSYFSDHKKEFVHLWIRLLKKHPAAYIDAFLELNIPYWYIGAKSVDPYSKREFIESGIRKLDFYPVQRLSKAPRLLKIYELFAKYQLFSDKPAYMSMLYSIALPIWVLLFCITVMIRQNRKKYYACFIPYLFLWATYMAGPVSNFRYIFPLYVAYPFFLFLAIFSQDE